MSDVEIVFPQGRDAIVRRLHDALALAGYDVDSRAVDGDSGGAPPDGEGAAAVLVLWDRSTMAHPGLQAVARRARAHDRAIDVSIDGITPLDLDDDRRLVQLSGWRGEPHHPGWRKILARLEQLCRPRAAPVRAAPPPRSEARAAAGERPPRRVAGRALLAAAAGILIVVVAVAALLLPGRSRQPAPARADAPSIAQAPAAAAPEPVLPAPAVPPAQAAAQTPAEPATAAPAGPAAQPAAAGTAVAETATPVATGQPAAAAPRRRRTAPDRGPRPAVRYTRYSGVMRQFCRGAGRHTPQCRVFEAATGR